MSEDNRTPTTAQWLGTYARELEAEGFAPELVASLVRDAAARPDFFEVLTVDIDSVRRDGAMTAIKRGKCGCCRCRGVEAI